MKKNLLEYDLQFFAEVEGAEAPDAADPVEEDTSEADGQTGEEETETPEPEQSDEDNARYASIRRRAEEDARRKYEGQMAILNQRAAAICQGIPNPATNKPIQTVDEYLDALQYQQRQQVEAKMQETGVDPKMIDRMIATNPVVMQAQQVLEQSKAAEVDAQIQKGIAEIGKYDPSIKSVNDLAALPNFDKILERVQRGDSLLEAYQVTNFDTFMQHQSDAGRQKAINQMKGKAHLPSATAGVATENDDIEVPAEIMARFKADGKTEKQIRELYKKVPH